MRTEHKFLQGIASRLEKSKKSSANMQKHSTHSYHHSARVGKLFVTTSADTFECKQQKKNDCKSNNVPLEK